MIDFLDGRCWEMRRLGGTVWSWWQLTIFDSVWIWEMLQVSCMHESWYFVSSVENGRRHVWIIQHRIKIWTAISSWVFKICIDWSDPSCNFSVIFSLSKQQSIYIYLPRLIARRARFSLHKILSRDLFSINGCALAICLTYSLHPYCNTASASSLEHRHACGFFIVPSQKWSLLHLTKSILPVIRSIK